MIMQVDEYKYLGTIIRSTKRRNQDVFYRNFSFIGDKARKAIFGVSRHCPQKLDLIYSIQ